MELLGIYQGYVQYNIKRMAKTLAFYGRIDGWVSFYSYVPDMMVRMNGDMYSFKNGELYLHHSDNVPRNNFYGVQYTSWVEIVFNMDPSIDWVYKNIYQESNAPWDVFMESDYTKGTIKKEEFVKKESRYFAHTRGNEDTTDFTGLSVNGIGRLKGISGTELSFDLIPNIISVGDKLVMHNNTDTGLEIGVIDDIVDNKIILSNIINAPVLNSFFFSTKSLRETAGDIRGHYLKVRLETDSIEFRELFAVSSNTVKSYVTI